MKSFLNLGLLLPLINAASSYDSSGIKYTYEVKVVYAKGLTDMDTDWLGWFGKKNYNDVYVDILAFGGSDDKIKVSRTSMDEEATEPRWEETFDFDDDRDGNGNYEKFLFKLYDSDAAWGDYWDLSEFLGETDFLYTSAIVECDKIYSSDLTVKRDGKAYGTLFVEVTKKGCTASVNNNNNNIGYVNNGNDYNNDEDTKEEFEKYEEEKESFEEYEQEKEEEEKREEEREEYEENKEEFEKYEEEKEEEEEEAKEKGSGGGKNKE